MKTQGDLYPQWERSVAESNQNALLALSVLWLVITLIFADSTAMKATALLLVALAVMYRFWPKKTETYSIDEHGVNITMRFRPYSRSFTWEEIHSIRILPMPCCHGRTCTYVDYLLMTTQSNPVESVYFTRDILRVNNSFIFVPLTNAAIECVHAYSVNNSYDMLDD